MKIAYFPNSRLGGTYSIFAKLRAGLSRFGFDFRCLLTHSTEDLPQPHQRQDGVDILPVPSGLVEATQRIMEYLQHSEFRAVMVLPGSGQLAVNQVRYLPRNIRCVARVCTMTRGAYAPTKAVAPFLDGIIAISDRIHDDLVFRYGLHPNLVRTIYNGTDPMGNNAECEEGEDSDLCHVAYLGRLEDYDKGVLMLPQILKCALRNADNIRLGVAGSGPDEERLRSKFAKLGLHRYVSMLGLIARKDVMGYLRKYHCFVMPSRFEGCGSALLEAMAAGCVPVASDIRGSIASIVRHENSGLLCRVGDPGAFGRGIARLAGDRRLREKLSRNARQRIESRFTVDHMARQYAALLREVLGRRVRRMPALPLSQYEVPGALKPSWRTRVPQPVKNCARKWLERFGRSV